MVNWSHGNLGRDEGEWPGQGRTLDTTVAIVFLGEQYSAATVRSVTVSAG